jgi:hypothetical protein
MRPRKNPTPETRFLSHLIVGCSAGAVVGQKSGPGPAVTAALLSACAHAVLDAPLAQVLTDMGA